MSTIKRKYFDSSEEEEEKMESVAGTSTSTKDTSDESETEKESDEEASSAESKEPGRVPFYKSLMKLSKAQFDNKEFFNKLVEEENAKLRPGSGSGKPMDPNAFIWKKGEIRMKEIGRQGGRKLQQLIKNAQRSAVRYVAKKQEKVEKGRHQTYLLITIPRTDISGLTLKEIWIYCRDQAKRRGYYAGETFAEKIGARDTHFTSGRSRVKDEMVKSDSRCFQIAVIVTESEEERLALEEYIIHYLTEQEENDKGQKLLNKEVVFKLDPDLRKRAKDLARGGTPLVKFEASGKIDPSKRYDLGFVCTFADFIEKTLK